MQIEREAGSKVGEQSGRVTLRTTEMETVYDMGKKMIESFDQQKIVAGDIIKVDVGADDKLTFDKLRMS